MLIDRISERLFNVSDNGGAMADKSYALVDALEMVFELLGDDDPLMPAICCRIAAEEARGNAFAAVSEMLDRLAEEFVGYDDDDHTDDDLLQAAKDLGL